MKHHIAMKFLAVFLASLTLFFALASGIGIVTLTALDLYENSVTDLYESNMASTRQIFAVNLVHRYASLHLGNLPEDYLNQYYGTHWQYDVFEYGKYFYIIRDENDQVVESSLESEIPEATRYQIQVTEVNYRNMVRIVDAENQDVAAATEMPRAADETVHIADATATSDYQDLDYYYDHSRNEQMGLYFTIQELPPYTVELYLLPGATPVEHIYSVLRVVWEHRYDLFYVLAFSILSFAVFSVYLCCAAGKKPGREEIRAGGFNCLPLDLYLAAGGGTVLFTVWLGMEVVEYLLRTAPKVLVPFVGLAGFGCCLIFVGFCFACVAQFKTPGGYWLRNSLTGRCCILLGKLYNLLWKALVWLWDHAPRLVRYLFRKVDSLIRWFWRQFLRVWNCCLAGLKRLAKKLGWRINRMYSLLPVTWQWLLAGCGMFLILALIPFSNGEELLTVFCIALFFGIILYGAHAFGILMEGAKRMGQGDLETKVSDQFLLGAFRDFAGHLNALAHVAVVAAQKQMKSERMKTELITNVSHDIKTPLTSIINYVDLLQKAETQEERETYLEVLSRQSMQLKKLIEDLMEMSKASTGNMNVDIVPLNAAEAINQALGEFADKLDRAQLTPLFRQPEEPVYMLADGRLCWRVLSNLLSNAVKYAMPGTRVYIDLMVLESRVVISMKNISREPLNVSADELLERFVRGDTARNTEGSGLGLNIAQSLMDIQKGQLQLLVDGDLFKVTLVFPIATL